MIRFAAAGRVGGFAYDAAFQGPAPGVTAILGPSGSGKTTLLRVAAGLARPQTGRLTLGAATVFDLAAGVWPAAEVRGCGYVFQDGRLFPHLSVHDNLTYGLKRARQAHLGPDQVIAALGLAGLAARRPGALSAGERQRVAIGRALLSQVRLLLMDEPLANLDAALKRPILGLIAGLPAAFGVTVLVVTHALEEAAELADALVVMEQGRVRAAGPIGAVLGDVNGPLAERSDLRTVWRGAVGAQDPAQGVTQVQVGDATLRAVLPQAPAGAPVRLQIFADDVILARGPLPALSLRNRLPVQVRALRPRADGTVLAALATPLGPDCLLAAITRGAVAELGLVEGARVDALFKASALSAPVPAPA